MPKNALLKKGAADPLALRLAALASLMDHVIASLRLRTDRIREARAALALARESDEPCDPSAVTGVRRRELRE